MDQSAPKPVQNVPTDRRATRSTLWTLLSVCSLIGIWFLGAELVNSRYVPGPSLVASTFLQEVSTGEYTFHLLTTLARVVVSFSLAMILGATVGIYLGMSPRSDRFFNGWLIFFLNLPALVTIILCYVWFGLTELAAILAVTINKVPHVIATLREGARSLSTDLSEMSQVFQLGKRAEIRHVVLPQLAPYFATAARTGLALVWKIVLVVEFLGRSNGVGFQLHLYFQEFNVAAILAYSLGFIVVVQTIDLAAIEPWMRSASRWRRCQP